MEFSIGLFRLFFLRNRSAYLNVCLEHENEIDNVTMQKIQDATLHKNPKDMAHQLRPVARAVDKCQADSSNLTTACHEFMLLLDHPVMQPCKSVVEKRFK